MSVEEVFKQQWEDASISVPLMDVVNVPVDANAMPEKWAGWLVQPERREDVTMGSSPSVDESGTIVIGLLARSGKGYTDLTSVVEEVKAAYHGFAKNGLEVRSVNGPHDINPEADGEWWRIALTADYIYYTKRSATGSGFGDWEGFPA